jgi:hypothetical protein
MDAMNAVAIETYNCDQKYGTHYHERLLASNLCPSDPTL